MKPFLIIIFFLFESFLFAQDPQLAEQYYENGEYEKAASLFEKFYQQNQGDFYFDKYINCLLSLENYAEAEKIVNKQLKKEPKKSMLYITLGQVYEKQNKEKEANEQYKKAIEKMQSDRFSINNIAMGFNALTKYDLALEAYEKGSDLLKNKSIFAFNLAELYRRKGNNVKTIESFIASIDENAENVMVAESMIQRTFDKPEDYQELQTQLYSKLQEKPSSTQYIELLAWTYLQNKDYKNAFRQTKALDKLLQENGTRVFNIADIALNDNDYDAAVDGYSYIIQEKGAQSTFYFPAQKNLLFAKRKKLLSGFNYTEAELKVLETDYENFININGKTRQTAPMIVEFAEFEAFNLKNVTKAIDILNEVIQLQGVDHLLIAKSKISLADYYLMQGENWESTLLYSQVDKAYKDDVIGHEARFKNAMLSYYTADFDWAKSQFDVLKSSTSKLISNDAIDMSVFILENSGTDTTMESMKLYAEAELLLFQNKYESSFAKMDTLIAKYPLNELEDDIWYLKAQIYTKLRKYDNAKGAYQIVIDKFNEGIRYDNALFNLANLYNQLDEKEKAKTLYEKIFTECTGSTLAVDARKAYRVLRGDKIQ